MKLFKAGRDKRVAPVKFFFKEQKKVNFKDSTFYYYPWEVRRE